MQTTNQTTEPTQGAYVLATKYHDADPGDAWCCGFYDFSHDGRIFCKDGTGAQIRRGGYRAVAEIPEAVGNWLMKHAAALEASPPGAVNLWKMLSIEPWSASSAAVPAQPTQPQPVATVIKKGADRQWMSENLGALPDGTYSLYLAAQPQQVEGAAPKLTVWEGPMPESNGKSNFTAILTRKDAKGFDIFDGGFTIARSEYPDRVRYEADCVRHIIGELAERPDILAYDADKHSGYAKPSTLSPEPAKVGGAGFDKDALSLLLHNVSIANRRDGWAASSPYETQPGLERAKQAVEDAEQSVMRFVESVASTHLAAKASGVQAADLAKLTKFRPDADGEMWNRDRTEIAIGEFYLDADVEALFNPPTGDKT